MLSVFLPPRLGPSFRWLLASSWITNLGDGIAVAAGPLLVASLTRDPFLISLAALLSWAPPLAFGLLIDVMGAKVLMVSSALSLSALAALFLIRAEKRPD